MLPEDFPRFRKKAVWDLCRESSHMHVLELEVRWLKTGVSCSSPRPRSPKGSKTKNRQRL